MQYLAFFIFIIGLSMPVEAFRGIVRTGGCNVKPGSRTYSSPGSFQFTVPCHNTMTVRVWGGGGAGGRSRYYHARKTRCPRLPRSKNGRGETSSFAGKLFAYGGQMGGEYRSTGGAGSSRGGSGGRGGSARGGQTNRTGASGASGRMKHNKSGPQWRSIFEGGAGGRAVAGGGGGRGGTAREVFSPRWKVLYKLPHFGSAPGGGGGGAYHGNIRSRNKRYGGGGGGGGAGGYTARTYQNSAFSVDSKVRVVVGAGGCAGTGSIGPASGGNGRVQIIWR